MIDLQLKNITFTRKSNIHLVSQVVEENKDLESCESCPKRASTMKRALKQQNNICTLN